MRGAVSSLSLILLLLLPPSRASGEVANPNLLPFGEEEAFLGNAGIAHSESTGATYYNPGALGFLRQKKISVYGNAYMAEHAHVRAGYSVNNNNLPIETNTFSPVPLSSVTLFGNEKYSYAFSIHVPHTTTYDYQVPYSDPGSQLNFVGSYSSSTLWVGPSFAKRDSDTFAWGVSLFALRHSGARNTILYSNKTTAPNAIGAFGLRRRNTEWALALILGAQWKLDPTFTLGARLQSPTLSLRGRTDYFYVAHGTVQGAATSQLENQTGIHSQYRLPLNLGVGARYGASGSLDLFFDLNAQLPIHYQTNPSHPSRGEKVNTRLRPRANLGGKLRLDSKHNLLMGILYNPSTLVVDAATSGALDEEDYKGITAGFQADSGVLVTTIGGYFLQAKGLYRTSDIFGTVTGTSEIDHKIYGLLLTASYRL